MITGNNKVISLSKGTTFGGQIAQYMGIPAEHKDLAVEGKDFTVDKSIRYANDTWAVVHFKTLTDRVAEGGYAVFHKEHGIYTIVISPSTSIMSTYLHGMPDNLVAYLYKQGVVYEPDL
jgi:hypothetical protein